MDERSSGHGSKRMDHRGVEGDVTRCWISDEQTQSGRDNREGTKDEIRHRIKWDGTGREHRRMGSERNDNY